MRASATDIGVHAHFGVPRTGRLPARIDQANETRDCWSTALRFAWQLQGGLRQERPQAEVGWTSGSTMQGRAPT